MFHSYSVHLASHKTTHSLSFIHRKGYPTIGVTPPPVISSASQRVTPSVISSASMSHPVGNFISQPVSHPVSHFVRQCESPRQSFRRPAWVTPSVISSASHWVIQSVVRQTASESPVRNFISQSVSHPISHFAIHPLRLAVSHFIWQPANHLVSHFTSQPAIQSPRQSLRQAFSRQWVTCRQSFPQSALRPGTNLQFVCQSAAL